MIKSVLGSAKMLVKNPLLLLPSLAAIAIFLGLTYIFAGFLIDLLLNAVFLELVPDAPLAQLPFQFIAIYFPELVGIFVLAIISAILFTALNYWYAAYVGMSAKGKASIGKACGETISELGKVISFVVFILAVLFLFGFLAWLFLMVALAIPLLGFLLLGLLGFLGFYLYIKLAFAISSMALEEAKVKEGLKNSWNFVVKKVWSVVLLVAVVAVINQFVIFVGAYATDFILDDLIGLIVIAVFWSIVLAFAGLAFPRYYSEKKLGE